MVLGVKQLQGAQLFHLWLTVAAAEAASHTLPRVGRDFHMIFPPSCTHSSDHTVCVNSFTKNIAWLVIGVQNNTQPLPLGRFEAPLSFKYCTDV